MALIKLLTKKNIEILKLLVKEELHIREIADKLSISPASVHNFIRELKKYNGVKEIKEKNRKKIKLNNQNKIIKEIKRIINYETLLSSTSFKKLKKIGSVGIYGSFASGENDNNSDIDLWIITEKSELKLRPILRSLENELGYKVNPLFLSEHKIKVLEKEDYEFYLRLKLTSLGDSFD